MSSRKDVAAFWDQTVSDFFAGKQPHVDDPFLQRWHSAYSGGGRGTVTTDAFPEPYIGPLSPEHGEPILVALGLNPGEADLEFQGREGIFQGEILRYGSYSAWANTAPYLRAPWKPAHRHNRYHANLRTFAQRWTGITAARSEDVLVLELFPWHSDKVTASMRPDPQLIKTFVWEPLAEINIEAVFGLGKDWLTAARGLLLKEIGITASFSTPTRQLRSFELPSGQILAVVWQPGYSGPPGSADVEVLQTALSGRERSISSASIPGTKTKEQSQKRSVPMWEQHRPPPAVSMNIPGNTSQITRSTHLHSFARHANAGLSQEGFGRVRIPASLRYMSVEWPRGLWYRKYTQNDFLHINITDDRISIRVHIDAFHGDRPRNEAAFDIIRAEIEHDLLAEMPVYDAIDWRAARGGDNQVCAVSIGGGVCRGEPQQDAGWVIAAATAWLHALRRHPIDGFKQIVEGRYDV